MHQTCKYSDNFVHIPEERRREPIFSEYCFSNGKDDEEMLADFLFPLKSITLKPLKANL